ncbi:MAG: cell division protein FtsB [Candidatus Omnitrophota bacterium]|jgi:cell division protein FtsB
MKNSFWIIIFGVLVLAIYIPSYSLMQDKAHKNGEYDVKILELQGKQIDLKEENRLLKEDPNYLEKVAREKMGLVKEGEIIVEISPELTE